MGSVDSSRNEADGDSCDDEKGRKELEKGGSREKEADGRGRSEKDAEEISAFKVELGRKKPREFSGRSGEKAHTVPCRDSPPMERL